MRRNRKNKKSSRKNRKANSRRNRKANTRRSRRSQRGGAVLSGSPLSAPSMLLTPAQAARAGTADFSNPLLEK